VCKTIEKFFNSRIGSEEQMKSNECHKKEACIERKHLKRKSSEENRS